jgi:hypothetical protein
MQALHNGQNRPLTRAAGGGPFCRVAMVRLATSQDEMIPGPGQWEISADREVRMAPSMQSGAGGEDGQHREHDCYGVLSSWDLQSSAEFEEGCSRSELAQ